MAKGPPKILAFSLVELLAVLAIVALLAAVTGLGLRGLASSSSLDSASELVMGTLDRARMEALSSGQARYVVFQAGASPAMVICEADTSPLRVRPIDKWQRLPHGIAFRKEAETIFEARQVAVRDSGPAVDILCPYIRFGRDGAVERPQEKEMLRVVLFQGYFEKADGVAEREVPTGKRADGSPVTAEITINPLTGRATYEEKA